VQQELVRVDIERMGHKITNVWNIRHRVAVNPLSLVFLDIEPAANNSEIYHLEYLQNMRVQIQPPHQKQNNIPQCKRCQAYFHTRGYWAHRPRSVNMANHIALNNVLYQKHNQQRAYILGKSHLASYRGCKVYQEIIRTRFSFPRTTVIIHITNALGQDNESPAAPQKTEMLHKVLDLDGFFQTT
jgi:hypothetical protein